MVANGASIEEDIGVVAVVLVAFRLLSATRLRSALTSLDHFTLAGSEEKGVTVGLGESVIL